MEITVYELVGLIKDGKAPKNIEYNLHKWIWDSNYDEYFSATDSSYGLFQNELNGILPKSLNDKVEILPEENDGWEDIEEFEIVGCNVKIKIGDNETFIPTESLIIDYVLAKVNQLIKNQKYLKEKLESKDVL